MENELKVSIIVISYNTNYRLIETLESIVKQTYKNLEVIIADDASSDNSIYIYKEWVYQNRHKYNNIDFIILDNKINQGIEKYS